MHRACFYLVRIKDVAAARSWLAAAHVTTARTLDPPPDTALQVAFTSRVSRRSAFRVKLSMDLRRSFASGMAGDESRSRRFGDVGPNHPSIGAGVVLTRPPHLAIMMYGKEGTMEQCEAEFKGPSWDTAFEVLERLHDKLPR